MGQTIRKYRTVDPNSELPLLLHKKKNPYNFHLK